MAAAGHELSKVAEQQAGVYSNLYNSVGHIVNRSLNASAAPGTVVNKQESQSAPVTLSSVATAIRSLFEG
jgi:alpha-D-ribose 1-methylphosphonate 5-triphosphate synthase subunit PhnH